MFRLLESGKDSDFTVTCREKSWKVHCLIFCQSSEFFQKACNSEDFKVSFRGAPRYMILSSGTVGRYRAKD